jgi:leucyl aminopeptidase
MEVVVEGRGALDTDAECVVFSVMERSGKDEPFPSHLSPADSALGGLLSALWNRNEIKGKRGEVSIFHMPGGKRRIAITGLGKKDAFSPESVRLAAGHLGRQLKGKGLKSVAFHLPAFLHGSLDYAAVSCALADGFMLGSYEFTHYKSEKSEPQDVRVIVALGEKLYRSKNAVSNALDWETKLLEAVIWTRETGNLPSDVATPEFVAGEAMKLAKEKSLKVTVFDEKQLREMGCGGILAVGGGSSHPPRLVVLEYPGSGAARKKTVAIVGKGITFDSGGISIKPAPNMAEMKFDKSGAMAVMGTLRAAADLKFGPRIIGIMSLAENLPSGTSYRPGDIVKTFSGKTIEVLNTDAEGRVVLADALAYVTATYHPDEVVDLATLTGACVVALGVDTAGLFCTNEELARRLLAASDATGEKLWRMPLTQTHKEMVKSDVADVKNSTEMPPAGASTAAAFLSEFVGSTPWAHLDIAGPAAVGKVGASYCPSYMPSGFTAFGVRLLTSYLSNRA